MLSRVTTPDLILAAFVLTITLWVLLAEFLPGKRSDDPPDSSDEEPRLPALLPA